MIVLEEVREPHWGNLALRSPLQCVLTCLALPPESYPAVYRDVRRAVIRLLRSPDEVARFEQTLEKLARNPDPADLPSLHLILDDACEQPEVMFSLVHFLESFNVQEQELLF